MSLLKALQHRLDGEQHGPEARRLLAHPCGGDPVRWRDVRSAARGALEARKALWDGIAAMFDDAAAA